jgi:hypothetical protein
VTNPHASDTWYANESAMVMVMVMVMVATTVVAFLDDDCFRHLR